MYCKTYSLFRCLSSLEKKNQHDYSDLSNSENQDILENDSQRASESLKQVDTQLNGV